jgi:hypothetical protein
MARILLPRASHPYGFIAPMMCIAPISRIAPQWRSRSQIPGAAGSVPVDRDPLQ